MMGTSWFSVHILWLLRDGIKSFAQNRVPMKSTLRYWSSLTYGLLVDSIWEPARDMLKAVWSHKRCLHPGHPSYSNHHFLKPTWRSLIPELYRGSEKLVG